MKQDTSFLLSVLLFFCLYFSSCERRELTYFSAAQITISADWSRAGLNDQEQNYGATAVFYPVCGGKPILVLMGDRKETVVRLGEGLYDVILFNRSFDDFGGIAFRGEDRYRTLEAYGTTAESPDELAADRMERFEVTPGMLGNYAPVPKTRGLVAEDDSCHLCFTPEKLTKEITALIRIKGMNNIRTATCTLSGVSESIFLASGQSSEKTLTQEFTLRNPVFLPGSLTEGTMSATFSVFGFDETIRHDLHLNALLVDGKTRFEESFDNVKISRADNIDGTFTIIIDLTCTKTIPNVKVEGGSGLDADVDDWPDEEDTDVNI